MILFLSEPVEPKKQTQFFFPCWNKYNTRPPSFACMSDMIKLSRKTMLTRGTMGMARKVVCGQQVGRNGGGFGVAGGLTLSKAAVSLLLRG